MMSTTTHIPVPIFCGTQKGFTKCKFKLGAVTAYKGLSATLLPTFTSLLPPREDSILDVTDSAQKLLFDVRADNAKMMTMMIAGQESDAMINAIGQCQTPDFPLGEAHSFYTLLLERFAPSDAIAEMNMEDELAKLKINGKDDPRGIDDEIAKIKMRYGVPLSDDRKAAIIMRVGRKNYASTLTTGTQTIVLTQGRKPYSKELLDLMHTQWRISDGRKNEQDTPMRQKIH